MGLQCDPTVIYALERAGRYNGNLTRERPAVRLALQHVSLRRPAAGTDCLTRPRLARRGRGAAGRAVPVFRQPQRRIARLRDDARRAQPQRAAVPGEVLQGAETGEAVMQNADSQNADGIQHSAFIILHFILHSSSAVCITSPLLPISVCFVAGGSTFARRTSRPGADVGRA